MSSRPYRSAFHFAALSVFGICATLPRVSYAASTDIELVLRLQERVSLETLATSVIDPQSDRYGKFYTPEEIRDIAGPIDFDYERILQSVQANGLTVISEDKTHLFVTVRGTPAAIERAFGTRLEYVDAEKSRHRLLQQAVTPEDWNGVASVIGLDNTRRSSFDHIINTHGDHDQIDGFSPSEIKSMYGFDPIYKSGITGKGQHIAIATYNDFNASDATSFWTQRGIKPAPALDKVFFNGTPTADENSAMETELDVEFSGMIAPGAQIHVFPSAHNDDPGEVQIFTAILDDNRAKVINYSWGDCEANVTPQHEADMTQVFARAVAQGVNVLPAAGDWGSYGCPPPSRTNSAKATPGKNNADWPAANPWVVAIGGTSIGSTATDNVQETAWNSTGGGISVLFDRPTWQSMLPAPFVKRSFPDVAFNADPYTGESAYVHSNGSAVWLELGGTSIAAPQWSGFLTLVGESRGARGPLGYLNPIIYAMSDADRAAGFRDIVSGSNGAYKAGKGWDATTGWGSMRADGLLQLLSSH